LILRQCLVFKWPTNLARTAVGLITGGAVAQNAGLTSPWMLVKDLSRGTAFMIMSPAAVATSVGVSVATNSFASGLALEAGIVIGSGIDATIQTAMGHCR
jgi:hypothetical protein